MDDYSDQQTSRHVYECLGFRHPYEPDDRSGTLHMTTRQMKDSQRVLRKEYDDRQAAAREAAARMKECPPARQLGRTLPIPPGPAVYMNNGIKNSGNTCFISSVLQFFFHSPQVMNDIANAVDKVDMNSFSLLREILRAFFDITSREGNLNLSKFLNVMRKYIPQLADGRQHDAAEFLQLLAEQCQMEISRYIVSQRIQDAFSKKMMLLHDPFMMNFGLTLRSTIRCPRCGEYGSQIRTNYSLFVPFLDSRLEKCIDFFFKDDRIITCEKCKACQAKIHYSIYRLPRYLFIQLERFDRSMRKINKAVSYPKELDFREYGDVEFFASALKFTNRTKNPQKYDLPTNESSTIPEFQFIVDEDEETEKRTPVLSTKYNLKSIILHQGEFDFGHYSTAIASEGQWTVYSDTEVNAGGNFDKSMPYIFVYEKASA